MYFFGAGLAYGAGAAFVVVALAYSFAPNDLARLRDWLVGSMSATFTAYLIGVALCVVSHLRWQ